MIECKKRTRHSPVPRSRVLPLARADVVPVAPHARGRASADKRPMWDQLSETSQEVDYRVMGHSYNSLTELRALQWINLNHSEIQFVTLTQ